MDQLYQRENQQYATELQAQILRCQTRNYYHIISECRKLAQREYKTSHNWVGKVIQKELCKKLKFDHTTEWYMYKPESVVENKMHKLLWNFEVLTDHLIPTRKPDLVVINEKKKKKKERKSELAVSWTLPSQRITE